MPIKKLYSLECIYFYYLYILNFMCGIQDSQEPNLVLFQDNTPTKLLYLWNVHGHLMSVCNDCSV